MGTSLGPVHMMTETTARQGDGRFGKFWWRGPGKGRPALDTPGDFFAGSLCCAQHVEKREGALRK